MSELTRRNFALTGAAAAFAPMASAKLAPLTPGIKISMQVDESVTDEDLTWIKQMGVDYLNVQTGNGRGTLENFQSIKKRVEASGLKVWNISNSVNRNIEEVTLNLPGREGKIDGNDVPRSVARAAIEQRAALAADDAIGDARLGGESVIAQNVR